MIATFMKREFEMSLMGELNYFLGLQIKQTKAGVMIHQQKYLCELLNKFNMEESKSYVTQISTSSKLD